MSFYLRRFVFCLIIGDKKIPEFKEGIEMKKLNYDEILKKKDGKEDLKKRSFSHI